MSKAVRLLRIGTHTQDMSKNISVSDEVYERLKREKNGRSFSEVIAETLERGSRIADVAGGGILEEGVYGEVERDIEELSRGTLERVDE